MGAEGARDESLSGLRRENRRGLDSRRVVARVLDWLIVAPFAGVAVWEWGWHLGTYALFQCLLLIYHHVFEVTTGATPGKRLLGLRVARIDDGGLPRPRQAAARGVVGIFEFGLIACVAIVVTRQRRRLGDYAAGTAVVSARKHPVASRRLFGGAVAYPVAWAVPAVVACVLGANGDLAGTYRQRADAICSSANGEVRRAARVYGVSALPAVFHQRDERLAALWVPNAWHARHDRLLATLRAQTTWASVGIAAAYRAQDPGPVLRRFASDPRTRRALDVSAVGAMGYRGCSGETV